MRRRGPGERDSVRDSVSFFVVGVEGDGFQLTASTSMPMAALIMASMARATSMSALMSRPAETAALILAPMSRSMLRSAS